MVEGFEVKELPTFADHNFIRQIRASLNAWQRGYPGAKGPDEILTAYLDEVKRADFLGWPNQDLLKEAKSILLRMEHPMIVRSVAVRFRMNEREAFWLCLGLATGAKALLDMFSEGLEDVDEAISTG
jgi:hypothetical protein